MTSLAPRVHFWPRPLVGRVNGMIKTDWPPHAVEQKKVVTPQGPQLNLEHSRRQMLKYSDLPRACLNKFSYEYKENKQDCESNATPVYKRKTLPFKC